MTPFVVSVAYVLIWRLCVLACGLVAIILGYRLFQSGFAAQQGSLEAGMGSNSLKLGNVAPAPSSRCLARRSSPRWSGVRLPRSSSPRRTCSPPDRSTWARAA